MLKEDGKELFLEQSENANLTEIWKRVGTMCSVESEILNFRKSPVGSRDKDRKKTYMYVRL